MVDLRLGDWREALADVDEVDHLITDPPYSARTHAGRRTGSEVRKSSISYDFLTAEDVAALAAFWAPRVRGWAVIFCDHQTRELHAIEWKRQGFYVFGPVRWVKPDAAPRMSGDGPTSSTEDILVARTKQAHKRHPGSRVGHYIEGMASGRGNGAGKGYPGRKPLALMLRLVQDYSLAGDLVVDPFSGTGTTARACQRLGRRFVGAEIDQGAYARAQERLRGLGPSPPKQPNLFAR